MGNVVSYIRAPNSKCCRCRRSMPWQRCDNDSDSQQQRVTVVKTAIADDVSTSGQCRLNQHVTGQWGGQEGWSWLTMSWVQLSARLLSPLLDTFAPPLMTSDRRFTHWRPTTCLSASHNVLWCHIVSRRLMMSHCLTTSYDVSLSHDVSWCLIVSQRLMMWLAVTYRSPLFLKRVEITRHVCLPIRV